MARGSENLVVVTGLRETLNGIKKLEESAPKKLRDAMKAASLVIVDDVRRKVPRRRGKAASSVRARGGVKGAQVAVGGASAPYYPWLDFGGTTGKGHRPGRAYSGSVERTYLGRPYGDGRYLYPSIADNIEDVQDAFISSLNGLLTQYGMKVEGSE